jgi:hypothetical protein
MLMAADGITIRKRCKNTMEFEDTGVSVRLRGKGSTYSRAVPYSFSSTLRRMSTDELTSTAISALTSLSSSQKADFLLNISLSLISAGQYGVEVERYLDVYLRTPNLPKESIAKALLARADARKLSAEKLLERAKADYQAVLRIDSGKEAVNSYTRMRMNKVFGYVAEPSWTRTPAEIWTMIASHIPRYHLRTWLFVSSFHRSIALPLIFHTLDLYFGEDSSDNLNRGLDILDKAKTNEGFARLVKCLRLHWAFEDGDMLDLMIRTFKGALPAFKDLKEFEWIGYPEMRADSVKTLLGSHPKLQGLGSMYVLLFCPIFITELINH